MTRRRSTLNTLGWVFTQHLSSRLIFFIAQIVLARILLPKEFAVFALAQTATTIISALTNFGVDDVLLQRKKKRDYWNRAAFVVSLSVGLVSLLAALAITPALSRYYHSADLIYIIPIIAISFPFNSVSAVYSAHIRGNLKYGALTSVTIGEVLLLSAMNIILASYGFGPLSLVIPVPIVAVCRLAALAILANIRIGRSKLKQYRMIGINSSYVFGSKLVTTILGQGDYIVLGTMAQQSVVGAYYFAFKLSLQPIQFLAGSLQNVLLPTFVNLNSDKAGQLHLILRASRVLSFVVAPLCVAQAVLARPLVLLVFGSRWESSIPFIQILSIGLAFDSVSWIAGAILSAKGEYRKLFFLLLAQVPIFFSMVIFGGNINSAQGIAISVAIFYTIFPFVFTLIVFRGVGIKICDTLKIYAEPLTLICLSILPVGGLCLYLKLSLLITSAITICAGSILYVYMLKFVARDIFAEIVERVRKIASPKEAT